LTRFTFSEGNDSNPIWSPDGRALTFQSTADEPSGNIYRKPVDGSSDPQRLAESRLAQWPCAWSRDGRTLVYGELTTETRSDLWLLSPDDEGTREPFLVTRHAEVNAAVSPDGRLLAYTSDESGRPEVYVRPFPRGSGKWQVSTEGGDFPRWSPDGAELFFINIDKVMSVFVWADQGSLETGKPQVLFQFKGMVFTTRGAYDVAPDGRFVFIQLEEPPDVDRRHLRLVFNWFDELRAKVPTAK